MVESEKSVPVFRGGNWNNGSNAGLGCANCNNDFGNANNNIGARSASKDRKGQIHIHIFLSCIP